MREICCYGMMGTFKLLLKRNEDENGSRKVEIAGCLPNLQTDVPLLLSCLPVLHKDCILFEFYDTHDAWHLLSAYGLFFNALTLLALDDDLTSTPRDEIYVF